MAKENQEIGKKLGEEQGAAKQIVEFGEEFSWSTSDILQKLQNKLNLSVTQADKYISMYGQFWQARSLR